MRASGHCPSLSSTPVVLALLAFSLRVLLLLVLELRALFRVLCELLSATTTFHCFKLFHPTLFTTIYGYSHFFVLFMLFHLRLFIIIIDYFGYSMLFLVIVGYFTLGKL
jgi:hypothetical protein